MTDASPAAGREPNRTGDAAAPLFHDDAAPLFPSEGSFSPVVPLSQIDQARPHPFNVEAAGKPAEAAWAREDYRAGSKEDEETLVPAGLRGRRGAGRRARAAGERPSWSVMVAALVLSVAAGLASGAYLVWSSQRAPEAQSEVDPASKQATAQPAVEAPRSEPTAEAASTPAVEAASVSTVEKAGGVAKPEKVEGVARTSEERPRDEREAARASSSEERPRDDSTPAKTRAERHERAAAEAREPAPKPAQSHTPARVTTAKRESPGLSTAGRAVPVSLPPPSSRSKRVIQWP